MPKNPLKPDDFPVHADKDKIKKQDATPIAEAEDVPLTFKQRWPPPIAMRRRER